MNAITVHLPEETAARLDRMADNRDKLKIL
jgi:predicted transcriptional regulator